MSELLVNIKKEGEGQYEPYSGDCRIDVEYEQTILDAIVYVDESPLINSYNIKCEANWIDIERVRNILRIIIKKNNTFDDRVSVIEFTHNMDVGKYINLEIVQKACEYEIEVDKDYILFDTLLDKEDSPLSQETITITTKNGVQDFGIAPVVQYAKNFDVDANENELHDKYEPGETIEEGQKYWYRDVNRFILEIANEQITVPDEGDYFRYSGDYTVKYDNGLNIKKLNKTHLQITNYGKVSLYDDTYYIVTVYHVNNPKSNYQIRIDYVNSLENNDGGFSLDDGE